MALTSPSRTWKRTEAFLWSLGVKPDWANAQLCGRYGEWLGRKFLKSKGYHIVVVNWRSSFDRRQEIDIVCRKDGVLVFVEVRARSEKALVRGFNSLGSHKMKSLRRSFMAYLRESGDEPIHHRFDVIEVDLPTDKGNNARLFHHENIAIFG
ncbi:MAG: hypothetical protein CMI29_09745 [Opitutae bacterium]|nr:hypothetical protein [Opitutae bacterium]